MKLVYCSCVCSERTYEKLFSHSSQMPGQQVQKYNRVMLKGLSQQENVLVEAISKIPLNSITAHKTITRLQDERWNDITIKYLPYYNIPKLSNLLQIFSAIWVMSKVRKEKDTVVILDILNVSLGLGVSLACRLRRIKMIGIVTDLPEFLSFDKNSLFVRQCRKIINRCNGYVMLTEAMNDTCNPQREKPYVVIEGQVDSSMVKEDNRLEEKYAQKVCLYSGNLDKINGIQYLVEGFLDADIPNAELHIYGSGDFVPELKALCKENRHIKYMGVKLNKEVLKAQIRAALLVNPRPTDQEFTKYSFPSKNMEYMASGTPLLTTKLPGMPIDYYPYVYLLEEETRDGIRKALKNILEKTPEELHEMGAQAKKFVLNHKSEKNQAKKVIEMIEKEIL